MRLAQATALTALAIALLSGAAGAEPEADHERALELFKESKALYQQGRFQEAIERLEAAYALEPEPVLLYNLGRAYESKGDHERAIEVYERYLREEPDAADRGAIEARVETLRRQIAERKALAAERERNSAAKTSQTPAPAADKEVEPERSPSLAPWIVVGGGAALLGAGVVLGLISQDREDEAKDPESSALAARDRHDEAERFATFANVGFIAGGVLVLGGVSWALLDASASSDGGRRAALSVSVTPTELMLRGRF